MVHLYSLNARTIGRTNEKYMKRFRDVTLKVFLYALHCLSSCAYFLNLFSFFFVLSLSLSLSLDKNRLALRGGRAGGNARASNSRFHTYIHTYMH